jgi:hypothetical protein
VLAKAQATIASVGTERICGRIFATADTQEAAAAYATIATDKSVCSKYFINKIMITI